MVRKRFVKIYIISLLTIFPFTCFAQGKWNGHLSVDGGTDFRKNDIFNKYSHTEGQAKIGTEYNSEKFQFKAEGNYQYNYQYTNNNGVTAKINDKDFTFDADIMVNQKPKNVYGFSILSGFKLSDRDKLTLNFTGNLEKKDDEKAVITVDIIDTENPMNVSYEESVYNKLSTNFNAEWTRTYEKTGRESRLLATHRYITEKHNTGWNKSLMFQESDDLETKENYDVYQKLSYHEINLTGSFKEKNLAGIKGLDAHFTLSTLMKTNIDHYDTDTLKNEILKIGQNENFNYFSSEISPISDISYQTGKIYLQGVFTPQVYLYRLNNEEHKGNINTSVNPLGLLKFDWSITENHILGLKFQESIKRPDYLKICWFKRQGQYYNEQIQGNVNLKSATQTDMQMSYSFKKGKFYSNLLLKNKYENRIIESTYYKEENYRIYTWINGGYSNTTAVELNTGWNGKILQADLTGTLNNFNGVSKSGNRTISNDYNIKGKVVCNFKYGWTTMIAARYQSDIKRNYISMTDYVGCDVRISKRFKKLEIYAEGKDLFDDTIVIGTVSEDESQLRYEEKELFRRIVKLGVIWDI